MVLNTLVHHPAVAHYLRFVATTVGRDKALRLLQYLARFLSWYFLRKGYDASTIAPWDAMKKNFGSVRKAMRIGKNIEHMKAATVALENKSLPPLSRYLIAARQFSYFGYLTLDTLGFLSTTKIVPLSAPNTARVVKESQRLWLAGIMFSLFHSALALQSLKEKEQKVVKTEAEGRLASEKLIKERKAVLQQVVMDGCDILIPATGLGLVKVDEGIVGLAGVVSSWLGLTAQWSKTA
ncbi:peroxisomal biogenesis factor 11 [Pyronema domesticum]|uniref:Similar to Peroxisomal membrane protein PMP27 acc. no. Q12462 n=1 Tax=Pyronema omphalodes (strain CBS 100304) TaxID=1076935 RepID=U4LD99_PYROM|nr:peroxisomal biogenesis factor 11 [Pyronema domesticum]CCX12522.1 Similar to Peroxisomal membrane protein PMP27; acc. no. Q12462 [Pyronema omphalodes CBS 100304]